MYNFEAPHVLENGIREENRGTYTFAISAVRPTRTLSNKVRQQTF